MLQYTIDCESDKKLEGKCAEVLSTKTKDVLKSEEFPKISSKCLEFLLVQDSLSAPEVEVFNSVCPSVITFDKEKKIKFQIHKFYLNTEISKSLILLSIYFSGNKQILSVFSGNEGGSGTYSGERKNNEW